MPIYLDPHDAYSHTAHDRAIRWLVSWLPTLVIAGVLIAVALTLGIDVVRDLWRDSFGAVVHVLGR